MSDSNHSALTARAGEGIRSLAPYQPGKPIEELQRELGIDNVIKLASNENPLGPGNAALQGAKAALGDMARYPDGSGFRLKAALAEYHGCPPQCITLGNGSNEVLEFVARVFAGPGDEIVFAEHCFIVYPLAALAVGAVGVKVPARDFGHDLEAMAQAVTSRTRVVFIANPNNPTGTWADEAALSQLLAAVPADCMVVVDEAYFEYVDREGYPDASRLMARYPNLMVTRTFSKVHGLAAMRIGYALTSPDVADLLNRVRMPFNVNEPSMAAAEAALGDSAHVAASIAANNAGMAQLEDGFRLLGLDFIPSIANFITFDCSTPAGPVFDALLREGVIVRPIGGYGLPNHLRVTIGTEAENSRFLAASARVLADNIR